MAKYLRPRRGAKSIAREQNFTLKSGELFLEFPNGNIGNEAGRIVIGNNLSSYSELNYTANNTTNEFQPFITDPSIYVPRFTDTVPSTTATAAYNYGAATSAISELGNGTTAGEMLPNIIRAIKKSLCKITDNVTALDKENVLLFKKVNSSTYPYIELNKAASASTISYNYAYKDITKTGGYETKNTNIVLSGASTASAGLMIAEDKNRLDKTPNVINLSTVVADGLSNGQHWLPFNLSTFGGKLPLGVIGVEAIGSQPNTFGGNRQVYCTGSSLNYNNNSYNSGTFSIGINAPVTIGSNVGAFNLNFKVLVEN